MAVANSTAETKVCKTCRNTKLVSEFHKLGFYNGRRTFHPHCKLCRANERTPASVRKYWHPRKDETGEVVKRCPRCKEERPIEQFPKRGGLDTRLIPYCRECRNEKGREYKKKNPAPPRERKQPTKQVRVFGPCQRCGKALKHHKRKYCSSKCHMRTRAGRMRKPRPSCKVCGQLLKTRVGQFCSQRCYGIKQHNDPAVSERRRAYWARLSRQEILDLTSKGRKAVRNDKRTGIEMSIEAALISRGLEYESQVRFGRFVVDFYIPSLQLAIECDGCYWHGCDVCGHVAKRNSKISDVDKDAWLLARGLIVARLKEHEIVSDPVVALDNALGLDSRQSDGTSDLKIG
jgi:very-short-patch-repair endonuclease